MKRIFFLIGLLINLAVSGQIDIGGIRMSTINVIHSTDTITQVETQHDADSVDALKLDLVDTTKVDGTTIDQTGHTIRADTGKIATQYDISGFQDISSAVQSTDTTGSSPEIRPAHDVDSIRNKYSGDFWEYGVVGNGVTDDAAALQAFITACGASKDVIIPGAYYVVNSTLTFLNGQKVDWNGSRIISGITNGDPVIYFPKATGSWYLKNVTIYSATYKNFVGVQTGDSHAVIDAAYFANLYNVKVFRGRIGFDINGWGMKMLDVRTEYCGTGFILSQFNGSYADIDSESDTIGLLMYNSSGFTLAAPLIETLVGSRPSRIDSCDAFTITAPYFETAVDLDSSFFIVGEKHKCSNFRVENLVFGTTEDTDTEQFGILFDFVDNVYYSGTIGGGVYHRGLGTTTRSTNVITEQVLSGGIWPMEPSKNAGNAYNYCPNSSFEVGLKGFNNVLDYNTTSNIETDTVYSGVNALKVTCAGGDYNYTGLYLTTEGVLLKNKKVKFSAWVYPVSHDGYEKNNSTRTFYPEIELVSYNGATYTETTSNRYLIAGEWNFVSIEHTLQSDATTVIMRIRPNNTTVDAGDSISCIVDDINLTESTVPIQRIMNSTLPEAPNISAICDKGNINIRADAVPTDTDQTYADGDQVWKLNNVAEASPGWICTTAGAGGTAVWCPMAVLGAAP